VQRVNQILEC